MYNFFDIKELRKMRIKKSGLIAVLVCIPLLYSACTDALNTDNTGIVFPEKNINYTDHVEKFVKTTCAMQGCHASETAAGGIPMGNWFELFNNSIVVPGKPDQSLMIGFLSKKYVHPISAVYIQCHENQLAGMRQWIVEGAPLSAKN